MRFGSRGFSMDVDVDPDEIARSISSAFVGMDDDFDGQTYDETVEKTFTVDGTPRLRVRNVSGETAIRVGEAGQVRVVARKRVRGGSADRAKRLLENVELRIEQRGNDIYVEPHLYEQERSWLDLFRGKRFRVDFEITVPRECAVDAQRPEPMTPPVTARVRDLLERVARGELGVDEAAAQLDETRRS